MGGGSAVAVEIHKSKPGRLAFLAICLSVMAVLLLVRLLYWQALHRSGVPQTGEVSQFDIGSIGWRGTIFDSRGHYLAVPTLIYDVGVSPRLITDTVKVAGLLAPLLNVPESDLVEDLGQKDLPWVPLARGLSTVSGQAVRDLKIQGIQLDPRPGRYYPEGQLAAAVLGFVNSEDRAFYGLEEQYDSRLRGINGSERVDAPQVLFDLPFVQPPRNGADLVLTIDRVVQRSAERHLEEALKTYQAESGSIIVMDPRSGALLAMAVVPTFDLNAYGSAPPGAFTNRTISEQYEPGSVFKAMTMAAALDAGAVKPGDTYNDEGYVVVGGRTFRNWDRMAHGMTTMTGILAHSLNVGAVHVVQKLDAARFYEYVRRFGFGQRTGIDLAGEIAGTVREPGAADWWPADLAANSFGQGLAATPLQVVSAMAAIANGGVLMRPYMVDRIAQDGKVVWQATPQPLRRVISAETAATLNEMMIEALPQETPLAVVPQYTSAGKTGTAEIFINGQYDDELVIASFAGYIPARQPRLVVLVKLDRPRVDPWGSRAAAPVWRSLASEVCAYLGVPPDQVSSAGG